MVTIVSLTKDNALRFLSLEELKAELTLADRSGDADHTEDHPAANGKPVYWIDMTSPTAREEEDLLLGIFDVHTLALEDCRRVLTEGKGVRSEHLPKVEEYERYLFAIINPLTVTDNGITVPQVTALQLNTFLGEHFIITHHYEELPAIGKAMALCSGNPRHIHRGPDFIYHIILDFLTDDIALIMDKFDEKIDTLEDDVFSGSGKETLEMILAMKRQVFQLRKVTTYQREMLYRLSRGEFDLITDHEIAYYRNVFDHLVRAADLAESYRDVLTSLLDAYLSITSNRLNEVMKVLTIISTIFLPLTFIAGVYGMNFHYMPELTWPLGYAFAWGLMILTALGLVFFFRHRKWL